jgi:MFS family permease
LRHRPAPIATRRDTEESSPHYINHGATKSGKVKTSSSFYSLITAQAALCNLPIVILVVIASLDNADKQLLASSFPMLERTLKVDVKTLGYFSLFSNLSYALSLPLWGYLVHRYGLLNIHVLLAGACASWGFATIGIALLGSSIVGQAILRAVNGIMLGSILPLSQTLLMELVSVSMRGRAFGWMGLCEKLAGTLSSASVVYWDEHWEYSYWILGVFSIFMGVVAYRTLNPTIILGNRPPSVANKGFAPTKQQESSLTLRQICQRILKLPAFSCMVAQGIFGGTPWDMMSFLLLLMKWRGFTNEQVVSVQFTSGMSATLGGWLGGVLGDYASSRWASKGRIFVAFVSVAGGIPLYALFLYSKTYHSALIWINLFNLWGTWTPPAALRPICADLTRNSSERAQIISMWIVLEKTSGAFFGAPLVGYLTSNMLGGDESGVLPAEKANVLAFHLCFLSTLFWSICSFFWIAMGLTIQKSLSISQCHDTIGNESSEDTELNPLV